MSAIPNEIIVHLDETIDDRVFAELEEIIGQKPGIIAVDRRSDRQHLLLVVYDSAVARAADVQRAFQEQQLHAQLIGM